VFLQKAGCGKEAKQQKGARMGAKVLWKGKDLTEHLCRSKRDNTIETIETKCTKQNLSN
jgi:hypothetical protein